MVALWGGVAFMVWHDQDAVGDWHKLNLIEGWLSVVLVLFIASYALLVTIGRTGSGQPVRRRSGPLMVALVVAIEGATVAAFWYRLTLEAWLNLGLAFFASGYLLLAMAGRYLVQWTYGVGDNSVIGALWLLCPRHTVDSSDAMHAAPCKNRFGTAARLLTYLRRWCVPGLLSLVITVEILTHSGYRSSHVTAFQPTRFPQSVSAPAEGYMYGFLDVMCPSILEAVREVDVRKRPSVVRLLLVTISVALMTIEQEYPYLLALVAPMLGYYPAALFINGLFWWLASLAVWSLGRTFFGDGPQSHRGGVADGDESGPHLLECHSLSRIWWAWPGSRSCWP